MTRRGTVLHRRRLRSISAAQKWQLVALDTGKSRAHHMMLIHNQSEKWLHVVLPWRYGSIAKLWKDVRTPLFNLWQFRNCVTVT